MAWVSDSTSNGKLLPPLWVHPSYNLNNIFRQLWLWRIDERKRYFFLYKYLPNLVYVLATIRVCQIHKDFYHLETIKWFYRYELVSCWFQYIFCIHYNFLCITNDWEEFQVRVVTDSQRSFWGKFLKLNADIKNGWKGLETRNGAH